MDIMKIYVSVRDCVGMESEETNIYMLLFDGYCEGPYFNGTILNGGVDTQIHTANRHALSARYMMEGTDAQGQKCRVFVENNADMSDGYEHVTSPRIYTDSANLKWLEKEELVGKLITGGEQVIIEIRTRETSEERETL